MRSVCSLFSPPPLPTPNQTSFSLTHTPMIKMIAENILLSEDYRGFPIVRNYEGFVLQSFISRNELESSLSKSDEGVVDFFLP
jgi:hypothetical protein